MTAEEDLPYSLVMLYTVLSRLLIVRYFLPLHEIEVSDYHLDAMPRNIVLRQKILKYVGLTFVAILVTLMPASEVIAQLGDLVH